MRIAIIGAGFCGLATTWHLANKGATDLHLFDSLPIGQGTSGIAAGLLHAYVGAHAKKSWRADEGLAATHQLLQVAEAALKESIILNRGLIRLAVSDDQKRDFALAASRYPDIHWLTADECQQRLGSLSSSTHPGIFIDSAFTVDCKKYLQGLWIACAARGVQFHQQAIGALAELNDFDVVIATTGAGSKGIQELSSLIITQVKGQVLELQWPEALPPLTYPISSQAYLLMHPVGQRCLAGATFERGYTQEGPDIPAAINGIMPKLKAFLPELDASHLVGCRAGIRASTPDRLPILKQIDAKYWVLAGMGSKGLLYHAIYAQDLADRIIR